MSERPLTWSGHVAVYGPPGAGKSSTVETASSQGYLALDLEQLGTTYSERRKHLATLAPGLQPTLFGAADLKPEDLPRGTNLVLLLPSPEELVRRVTGRADRRGHKWIEHALKVRQEHELMAGHGVFDLVLRQDVPPDEILDSIIIKFGVSAP